MTLALKRVATALTAAPSTRISRGGLPDGFFFENLLWFGDAGSARTAVARGVLVEPEPLDALDPAFQAYACDRLRQLIASLGEGCALQVRYTSGGDYSDVLGAYRARTESIPPLSRNRWGIWNRTERHDRYQKAMRDGLLRRDTLALFFCRVIDSAPPFGMSRDALAMHFGALARREAAHFDEVYFSLVRTLFPEARVSLMGDREHFRHAYRFLNPGIGATLPEAVDDGFDRALSLQENCLFSDLFQPRVAGVSFDLDGFHHAILALRELPRASSPGAVSKLLNLGFSDFELTLNLYPQLTNRVVKNLGRLEDRLAGEAVTQAKKTTEMSIQRRMASERLSDLEEGQVNPVNVFMALRLWHRNSDTLATRSLVAKNAFVGLSGALTHHAANPETARQLFYQTFPGWTYGRYRGYDLETDDAVAADLIPWSGTFTGRIDDPEALYDSPAKSLVGVSFHKRGTPQHVLVAGATGAGKSVLFTDLLAQMAPLYDHILIVEEGFSHGTSVQALGANPIVLNPNGTVTLNYLDALGAPLSNAHFGAALGLCLQMLGESQGDPSRVSAFRGVLSQNLEALYDDAWESWSRKNPDQAERIARHSLALEGHLHAKMRPQDGDGPLDAWADWREREATGDDSLQKHLDALDPIAVARHRQHPGTRRGVRNLGFTALTPEEMPTHSQFCDLLAYAPQGNEEERREARRLGQRLATWKRDGPYGKLFDGVSTHRLDEPVTLFELSKIPAAMPELKAAAHHLILNASRQRLVSLPRAQKKLVLFEEGARILSADGGVNLLEEYFTQLRKYGAVVVLLLQQFARLNAAGPAARAAVMDNAKLFLVSAQPSPAAAQEVAATLELSDSQRETLKRFPSAEDQVGSVRYSSFLMVAPQSTRTLVGTFLNIADPAIVYCGASDGDTFDQRSKTLAGYDDIVTGLLEESKK